MKMKYFLRGLGVGILLTALVLCIGYRQNNSEETVVQRARDLGMEFPKKTPDTLLTASGSASMISPSPSAESTQAATETAGTTDEPTRKPESAATSEPDSEQETTKNTRTFTVRDGLLSSSVAREMREAGVIKDADAFDKYLEKTGMARKIRAGKYKIPKGAGYEEIAKIITRQ